MCPNSMDSVSNQHLLQYPGVACSQSKFRSVQDTLTCRDVHMQSSSKSDFRNDSVISTSHGQSFSNYSLTRDFPSPLAAKAYYSQKSNHLRSAVGHMYSASLSKGLSNDAVSPQLSQESILQLQGSSRREFMHEQVDGMFQKRISESNLDESRGRTPSFNFSNQTPVVTTRAQTAPVGLLRNKHLPRVYSFAGNSGQSLGTMQQPGGSVPVL